MWSVSSLQCVDVIYILKSFPTVTASTSLHNYFDMLTNKVQINHNRNFKDEASSHGYIYIYIYIYIQYIVIPVFTRWNCVQNMHSSHNVLWKTNRMARYKMMYLAEVAKQIDYFKQHTFIKCKQADSLEEKRRAVNGHSIVAQVDFAENYIATDQDEIQSAHWNHSKVTLFTVTPQNPLSL